MEALNQSDAVTLVVTRQVKRGREADYELWLERLLHATAGLPGYLGTTIHRPTDARPGLYTVVYRFASVDYLRAFEESEERRRVVAEVGDLVEADPLWERLTGLEAWFSPPPGTVAPQPSRLRMTLLMITVVFALVLTVGGAVNRALPAAPFPARLLVTLVLEIFFMTYWLMPRLTRWLAFWIYPK